MRPKGFDVDIRSRADGRVPGEVFRPGWLGNPTLSEDGCLMCGDTHEGSEGLECYQAYLEKRWNEYSFRAALSGIKRGNALLGPEDELHFDALTRFLKTKSTGEQRQGPSIETCREWSTIWKQDAKRRLVLLPAGESHGGTITLLGPSGEEAEEAFPGLGRKMGEAVKRVADEDGWYGVMISPEWPDRYFGLIQVTEKTPSSEGAGDGISAPTSVRLHLVRRSIGRLMRWVYGDEIQRRRHRATKYFEREHRRPRLATAPQRGRIDIPIGPRSHAGLEMHELWEAYGMLPGNVHLWVEPEAIQHDETEEKGKSRRDPLRGDRG